MQAIGAWLGSFSRASLFALGGPVRRIDRTVAISIESVEASRPAGKLAALNAAVAVRVQRVEPRTDPFARALAINRRTIEPIAVSAAALFAAFFHRLREFGAIDESVAVRIEAREALVVSRKLAAAEPAVAVFVGLTNSRAHALPDLFAMFGAIRRIELSIAVTVEPLKSFRPPGKLVAIERAIAVRVGVLHAFADFLPLQRCGAGCPWARQLALLLDAIDRRVRFGEARAPECQGQD